MARNRSETARFDSPMTRVRLVEDFFSRGSSGARAVPREVRAGGRDPGREEAPRGEEGLREVIAFHHRTGPQRNCGGRFRVFVRLLHAGERGLAGVQGSITEVVLDAEQLVVLGDTLAAGRGTGLNLAGVGGHREVSNRRVLGLAGAV